MKLKLVRPSVGRTGDGHRAVVAAGGSECERIMACDGLQRALDAAAAELIGRQRLESWAVDAVIGSAVGGRPARMGREPGHDEIAVAAYHLHASRTLTDDGSVAEWLTAERGLRFGIASAA